MNGLDLFILVLAVAAAVGGFRLGFVTRVSSWIGLASGIVLGSLLLPSIIDAADGRLDRGDLVVVAAAIVLGGALLGQAAGLFVGARLHVAIPEGRARRVDAGVGAVAGVLGLAVAVWLVVPVMADVPQWPARQARGSTLAQEVDRWFPDAPDASQSVRRLLGDRYPRVFEGFERAPEPGPPPASSGFDEATARRVARSTVLVTGEACGRIQEGSGFVIGEDLVATNAHVVAGESATEIARDDGTRHPGIVVAFDPERDLAIVSVPGIDRAPLPLGAAATGDRGAVFGHPGGGPLRLAPFEVGQQIVATGTDIYDNGGVQRDVLVLASSLQPGDSGSALVAPGGDVIGVAFAIAPDRPGVAYAVTTEELLAVVATAGDRAVGAGACVA